MIGRPPRAVGASVRAGRWGPGPSLVSDWLARLPGNRYSRRVALLKVALPAIGLTLLLLVVAWPRIAPLFDRFRLAAIDLREARELRMLNPRYAGTDRDGRPYVITAAVGRQVPQRDDVMALDRPVAHLKSHSGADIVVSADSGVYQSQTQYLDLFGNVTVTHENGSTFVTSSARLDAADNAAQGTTPVEGHGPQGDIAAQGFQIVDKGDIVIFTGQSNLLLKGSKGDAPAAEPAAVPAPVAQAAAQIEAKVAPKPAAAAKPRAKAAAHPVAKAPHAKPTVHKG
ncbi:MAG TPA: LPS export ABC transporter periplasmic protein LptC [Stellaceae bacterium]|nr:LPS export ABC transporter periplasmic protein LptC [Stellaceae bacterium]